MTSTTPHNEAFPNDLGLVLCMRFVPHSVILVTWMDLDRFCSFWSPQDKERDPSDRPSFENSAEPLCSVQGAAVFLLLCFFPFGKNQLPRSCRPEWSNGPTC